MKRLLLSLFALSALNLSLQAQGFEGTIVYKTIVSAPEGSPLAAMPGLVEKLAPKGMTIQIKGDRARSEIDAAYAKNSYTLVHAAEGTSYILNSKKEKYAKSSVEEHEEEVISITPLSGTETIAGYPCKGFLRKVRYEADQEPIEQEFWVPVSGFDQANLKTLFSHKHLNSEGAKGQIPLRIVGRDPGNQFVIIFEATSVKEESLPASLFEVPSGYREQKDKDAQGALFF